MSDAKVVRVRYFTSRDVAAACDVDLKSVHLWAEDPRKALPHFFTPGGHLRFRARDLAPWLRRHGYDVPVAVVAEEGRAPDRPLSAFASAVAALAAENLGDPLGRRLAALCAEHGVDPEGGALPAGEVARTLATVEALKPKGGGA